MNNYSLDFHELLLGYDGYPTMQPITGKLIPGSLTAIVGANGCGKSTLLKGIAGIIKPIKGACTVSAGQNIAYLPQISDIDRSFPASVYDLASLGLWPKRGLLKKHSTADKMTVLQALNEVGLENFEDKPISILSGGQFQRVLFARIILQDANIILLDEPFNGIDAHTSK